MKCMHCKQSTSARLTAALLLVAPILVFYALLAKAAVNLPFLTIIGVFLDFF